MQAPNKKGGLLGQAALKTVNGAIRSTLKSRALKGTPKQHALSGTLD